MGRPPRPEDHDTGWIRSRCALPIKLTGPIPTGDECVYPRYTADEAESGGPCIHGRYYRCSGRGRIFCMGLRCSGWSTNGSGARGRIAKLDAADG